MGTDLPTDLPLKPDEALIGRLQRAVEFLEHALSHVPGSTPVDRMVAIHGLDNSVEYLLRIVLDAFDIEARTGKNLDTVELASLVIEVRSFVQERYGLRLPYKTEVKKLRQLRNLVQHGMVDPAADLQSLATVVNRFYNFVFKNIFGVDPAGLRLSHLVRDEIVKGHLVEAERRIAAKRYLEAVVASRDAFDNAFYQRRRYSDLRLGSAPVLIDLDNPASTYFYTELVDEIERLRIGIDAHSFKRFHEYVAHIPAEFQAEWTGNSVMQRPCAKEDAEFCYRFTAQAILQWQNAEVEPLYEIDTTDLPDWIEHFGGVTLPSDSHIMSYLLESMEGEIETLVVGKDVKDALSALPVGREYDYVSEMRKVGAVVGRHIRRVELKNRLIRLLTHDPARWEVILYVWQIPLTWYRQEFENGSLKQETPSINAATSDELVAIYPDVITPEIADKIVAVRQVRGPYRTRRDVEQVPGIEAEQIDWLCRFTRADLHRPVPVESTPTESA